MFCHLQPTLKSMLKTWGELYGTFARLAALVTNAEANICCEDLVNRIVDGLSEDKLKVSLGPSQC